MSGIIPCHIKQFQYSALNEQIFKYCTVTNESYIGRIICNEKNQFFHCLIHNDTQLTTIVKILLFLL